MVNLDDSRVYEELDSAGMRGRIRELPQQCLNAWRKVKDFPLPAEWVGVERVVVLGMGGSAIGGDLARSLVLAEGGGEVLVHRDYDLPPFVDARTLVIASSYSGMTEETLSAFAQALDTPAKKMAITTGGRLRALGEQRGVPVLLFDYRAEPRTALGYSFISLVGILCQLGFLSDKSQDVEETVAVLREVVGEVDEGSPIRANLAKQLAANLYGRLPVIYGAGVLSAVARRWKTQLNENSKTWAFHELLPELNHNGVVGYDLPREIAKKVFVVLLESTFLHPRTLLRYRATEAILAEAGVDHQAISSRGQSALSQIMNTVLLGDYVSYYLALLNQVDPSPTRAIDQIKARLAQE